MQTVDWIVIVVYLIITMVIGIYLSGKASKSLEDFFLSGRSLTWWLAGTSMAATTFSIDTPLYICGIVATRGIAGNWEWWSFGIAHVVMIYIFARLWRRSEVVTDAELTELRYGGKMAAILRATKGFLFAVPINCIGIGYAMLAMVKVVTALQLWESLGLDLGDSGKLWSVIAVSIFVLVYSGFSGLWGVVVTDFFQFFLALFGAMVVAIMAVNHVGGIQELIPAVQKATEIDVLSLIPLTKGEGFFNWRWSDVAGISLSTFSAYVFVQWWSFRRSDGGGEFIQRLVSAKDEAEAEKAAWFFNILNYIVRTWPWILVALVAIVMYPDLEDPELGYPKLMLEFLPPAMLGLVVASLIAAFMSTVSTSINWGASYLTNDLYRRFFVPDATQDQLVLVGRIASIVVTFIGAIAAFFATDISTVFRLVIAIGTGPGLVLILRWYWWRINATAELAAMIAGFIIGLTSVIPNLNLFPADFGLRLMIISGLTAIIWITAMYLTPPESEETLNKFYLKVRPAGIGWRKQQEETGVKPLQNLRLDVLKVIASVFLLFGLMLSIGGFLLLKSLTGWLWLIIAVIGGFWLRHLNKQRIFPMPRPGLE
ncbi:MAG: Na+:solute symporter [Cyanobacteria bacterium]|nr:Na+:solute symporter [Cyanobacteria bacterium CG_2015-16_32_12]NCO79115.1 Na+:solute symporter [Cyanobacteria bacterium CG_2015-22_32_23]NCQ03692.1 Na+:solute symporter [Cyanobacteria bacterium CG_2015-09_32_10]NCQ40462.1 Na+:solute symporter [Cyanobacteria bacterium CG_2015-04_32_10]NCS84939.1 Na+:solute symporter [Cyanobacteria bacterium CG_2015-02_32_10]